MQTTFLSQVAAPDIALDTRPLIPAINTFQVYLCIRAQRPA
jgi:hypothetical protein